MSDYFYDYEYDTTYCYPQANVLKNKLNIKDADSLLEAERSITAQDIYGWAGKTRTVNISKGSQFCLCQFIDDQAIELFQKLERENYLVDAENIAERLSFYLSELNAIHPFREGNGRAQRMFIEILADRAGYEVDFSEVTAEEMIEASYQSFNQNYDPMNAIMRRITIPKE